MYRPKEPDTTRGQKDVLPSHLVHSPNPNIPSLVVAMSGSGVDTGEQRQQNAESKSITCHTVGSQQSTDNIDTSQVKTRSEPTSKKGEFQDSQDGTHGEIEPDTRTSPSSSASAASCNNPSNREGCGHLNSNMASSAVHLLMIYTGLIFRLRSLSPVANV